MSLSPATTSRLLKSSLRRDQQPLFLLTEQARKEFVEQLKARIVGLEQVQFESPLSGAEFGRLVVSDPSERYYHNQSNCFFLRLDLIRGLRLSADQTDFPVGSLEELVDLARLCQEAISRRLGQKKKQEKVRALKAQAVMAQVRQLVQSEGLQYAAETNLRGVKLYLNLDGQDCMQLDIPFSGFEQALPHVREAVQALRAMTRLKMRFRLHQISGSYRWKKMKWVTPQE